MSNLQQRNMCYAALWYDFDLIITDYTQLFAAMTALQSDVADRAAGAVPDDPWRIREAAG